MTLGRVAPLISITWIALGGLALAQSPMSDPTGMPGAAGAFGAAPTMMQPQQSPPCMGEFVPIRAAAEKRAHAVQDGIKRQVPPQELCGLFTSFSEAEAKMVKFIETNSRACGIPPEVLTQSKSNHGKTVEKQKQVCSAASFGERRGPGLGEALGMRAVPTPETTSAGKGGPFDTMSGSPLAR